MEAGDPMPPDERLADDPALIAAEAQSLYRAGRLIAAGMTARVALERWLQAAARQHALKFKKLACATLMAKALHGRGAIDDDTLRTLRHLCHVANKAAHGCDVSAAGVLELVDGARALVMRPAATAIA
jgi:hypothetical protein